MSAGTLAPGRAAPARARARPRARRRGARGRLLLRRLGMTAAWRDPAARRAALAFLAVFAVLTVLPRLWRTGPLWWSDAHLVRVAAWSAYNGVIFAALPALAFLLPRRFPLEGGRGVARALAAVMGLSLFSLAVRAALLCSLLPDCSASVSLGTLHFFPPQVLTVASVAAAAYGLRYARLHRAHEIAGSRLEAELSRARLAALKAQLHPHFLFNTLNSVSTLVGRDPAAAREVSSRLARLLQVTLARADQQEVPLAEELRVVEMYADIERVRFSDRLRVEVCAEPALRGALVPHFLLQPLVENAVKHGIAARPGPGRIRVTAAAEEGRLVLRVADDGPGPLGTSPARGDGIGVSNTRARLAGLYGAAHRFHLHPNAEGGTTATVVLPLRFAAEASSGDEVPR